MITDVLFLDSLSKSARKNAWTSHNKFATVSQKIKCNKYLTFCKWKLVRKSCTPNITNLNSMLKRNNCFRSSDFLAGYVWYQKTQQMDGLSMKSMGNGERSSVKFGLQPALSLLQLERKCLFSSSLISWYS